MKLWITPENDRDKSRAIAAELGISNFAAMLLLNRGMTDVKSCREFLDADKTPYIDPYLLPDMRKAVDRIEKALKTGEKIKIFGDYDVDGVTATAVLYLYLKQVGADVSYMLPSRDDGGYGLNNNVIDRIKADGTQLIVTVDNGISAYNETRYAKDLGIDVVVTDHHKPPEILPECCAVVDAFVKDGDDLPFREWAGVGVAYKLVCAIEMDRTGEDSESVGKKMAVKYGEYVALGSIADIVPLKGENRKLTAAGIERMRNDPSPGTGELIRASKLSRERLRAVDVAFSLAPKLNSAGRMGSPYRALDLLLCGSKAEAGVLADELTAVNVSRSMQEQRISSEVWKEAENKPDILYNPVTVICGKGWNTGIVGIFASRLCEKLGKPAIVLSTLDNDKSIARGSGRCFGDFSLYKALTACSEYLEVYGGHSQAAGLTIKKDKLKSFTKAINRYAEEFGEMPIEELICDCELHPRYLSTDLVRECELLEPFGAGTAQPAVILKDLTITEVVSITNGKHHRLTAKRDNTSINMMYFNSDHLYMRYRVGDIIDVVVTPDIDTYMGQEKLKLIIKDIRPSGFDTKKVIYETRIFERFMLKKRITKEEKSILYPSREQVADTFRLVYNNGYSGTKDVLIKRALDHGIGCGQVLTSLEVLAEAGIIKKRDLGNVWVIEVCRTGVKTNLGDSKILNDLDS